MFLIQETGNGVDLSNKIEQLEDETNLGEKITFLDILSLSKCMC